MKLSPNVLAALLALPLAGVALAADGAAGQAGIERTPVGAEALSPEVAPPAPGDSPAAIPASGTAASESREADAGRAGDEAGEAAATAPAAAGEEAIRKTEAGAAGETARDQDGGKHGEAAGADKDRGEGDAAGGQALGGKDAAPVADDDPALDRRREPAATPPAPADEEPASSRI